MDVWFSRNMKGCQNCFGCVGLRNKQYYIFNKPHIKEEYFSEILKIHTGSYKECQEILKKVEVLYRQVPVRYFEGTHNVNVAGDYIFNSKNVSYGFEVTDVQDSKYSQFLFLAPTKDSYDFTMWGGNATRMYECMGAGGGQNDVRFAFCTWCNAMNMDYVWSILITNADIFGCVALKNKKFCILNKQYTESEYRALREKIIEHMNAMPYVDVRGREYRYGEFFPPEFSQFGYNETLAQTYLPLTKEEAGMKGYYWRETEKKEYVATLLNDKIPDAIESVEDLILNEIIECAHKGACNEQCSGVFKLIAPELECYLRMNLPVPRLCSNCRHYTRLKTKNLMKLWHRACMCVGEGSGVYKNMIKHFHGAQKCPNEFETSYAPDRPEIVYCEQCYNAEVV